MHLSIVGVSVCSIICVDCSGWFCWCYSLGVGWFRMFCIWVDNGSLLIAVVDDVVGGGRFD